MSEPDDDIDALKLDFDFGRYPTLTKMQADPAKLKLCIGPAGSAKTTGVIAMLLAEAMLQPPYRGVRSTRTLVCRQSYAQLGKATVPSLVNLLGLVGDFTAGKPPAGKVTFPMGDGTIVEWEFVFQALESDNSASDLRGLEFSNSFIDEISELPSDDLMLLVVSRAGRYPSMMKGGCRNPVILGVTNGPLEGHFLHSYYLGHHDAQWATITKQTGRKFCSLFRQPCALIRPDTPDGEWTPNLLAENVHNLPGHYSYYYAMLSMSDAAISSFVEGEFAALMSGKPVYPGFSKKLHVLEDEVFYRTWGRGPLTLTFDFGRTPCCLITTELVDGRIIVLAEVVGEDTSIDQLWTDQVRPLLDQKFKGMRIEAACGDPSGADKVATADHSPFSILMNHGVPIEFPAGRVDRIEPRIEAGRKRLSRLTASGVPALVVLSSCKVLIESLSRRYIYRKLRGQMDVTADTPDKSHPWSDVADAFSYLCLYRGAGLDDAERRVYGDGAAERRPQRPMFAG